MEEHDKNLEFTKRYLLQNGERLKTLRKAKGFKNYEKFAYLNDIGRSQYGKYEKGADMRLSTFFRVLKAMNVNPIEFFSEDFDFKEWGEEPKS